ncbi:MAG: hypothetical protein FWC13_12530, partial [Oscillospiraceae bacterium]|nr:hypothetical protein [Oscillospiraceae bacterium]
MRGKGDLLMNNKWSNWQSRGGESGNIAMVAGSNQDGRLEAFVLDKKGDLRHTWQRKPNHDWS